MSKLVALAMVVSSGSGVAAAPQDVAPPDDEVDAKESERFIGVQPGSNIGKRWMRFLSNP